MSWGEKLRLLRAGILPLLIFFAMTGLFLMGKTNLTESSAVGATAATLALAHMRAFESRLVLPAARDIEWSKQVCAVLGWRQRWRQRWRQLSMWLWRRLYW